MNFLKQKRVFFFKKKGKHLELLPFSWWTWASTFLKSMLCWSLYPIPITKELSILLLLLFLNVCVEMMRKFKAHRVLVSSLRSLSESSKKREITSTTKSGLLSSWSCWSWLNWSSRNPLLKKEKKKKQPHVNNGFFFFEIPCKQWLKWEQKTHY